MNTRPKAPQNQVLSCRLQRVTQNLRKHTLSFNVFQHCSLSVALGVVGLILSAGIPAQAEQMDASGMAAPAVTQTSETSVNTTTPGVAPDGYTSTPLMNNAAPAPMTPLSMETDSVETGTPSNDANVTSVDSVGGTSAAQAEPMNMDSSTANTADNAAPSTATPGTTSVDLTPSDSSTPGRVAQESATPDVSDVSPGRATRSGSSYVGIGGNIGIGEGDTALGDGSFAVFSKIGLTSNISVRPTVLVNDNPTILLPLTLDFSVGATDVTEDISSDIGFRVNPFVGAGIAISTGDDSAVDFLATGGVDIPITSRLTGTASVSASLFDNPAVGILLGVGYNF